MLNDDVLLVFLQLTCFTSNLNELSKCGCQYRRISALYESHCGDTLNDYGTNIDNSFFTRYLKVDSKKVLSLMYDAPTGIVGALGNEEVAQSREL